jgi:transposase
MRAEHAEVLRERAPKVGYSSQVLWQELRQCGFAGSYQTVKRFVRPLRTAEALAERASVRFETPPGQQSQVDWGAARMHFRHQPVVLHFFVLTLGYSRRHYMEPALNERVPQFLDAHERAFDHFGGHTREHLYDRPRTICRPDGQGGVVGNPTFQSFARYWGFRQRPVSGERRARSSGVNYSSATFGRSFIDLQDASEQWAQWNASGRRACGTHAPPPTAVERSTGAPGPASARARLCAPSPTTSSSASTTALGAVLADRPRSRRARDNQVRIHHRGRHIASCPAATGSFCPNGPGAAARNGRLRRMSRPESPFAPTREAFTVEQRDLATYDALVAVGGER